MALNVPVFFKRLGSSIVFAAIMLTGMLYPEPWAFLILICLINFLCLRDFFRLMRLIVKDSYWPLWLQGVIQFIALLLILLFTYKSNQQMDQIVWAFGKALPVIPALVILIAVLSKRESLVATLLGAGGLFYIAIPAIFLMLMRLQDLILPLSLILMIWCNDTMAYLVGSFIGKTPFSPISPKKTWEGTIGGALLTIGGAAATGYFTHTWHMVDWMALALCATVAGTFGDLMESKLKRLADVKDSGTLMPGHGGALDRFDSLLIAAPFAFIYVMYFMK